MKTWLTYILFDSGTYRLTVGMIVLALFTLVITKSVVFGLRVLFDRRTKGSDERVEHFYSIFLLTRYVVWSIGIVFALQAIGLEISFLLAGSAALLVGLGLGLQQTFNDFISGIIILVEGSLKKNDVVEVDKLVGKVKVIQLRTSIIYTRDGIDIIVPNHKFINENVINWSHHTQATRFKVEVGVAYDSNESEVSELLLDCMKEHPAIIHDDAEYPLSVRIVEFGDSSINFEMLFWSQEIFNIEQTKSDLRFEILKRFRERGIVIPFPQRDLHITERSNPA